MPSVPSRGFKHAQDMRLLHLAQTPFGYRRVSGVMPAPCSPGFPALAARLHDHIPSLSIAPSVPNILMGIKARRTADTYADRCQWSTISPRASRVMGAWHRKMEQSNGRKRRKPGENL